MSFEGCEENRGVACQVNVGLRRDRLYRCNVEFLFFFRLYIFPEKNWKKKCKFFVFLFEYFFFLCIEKRKEYFFVSSIELEFYSIFLKFINSNSWLFSFISCHFFDSYAKGEKIFVIMFGVLYATEKTVVWLCIRMLMDLIGGQIDSVYLEPYDELVYKVLWLYSPHNVRISRFGSL